MSINTFGRVVVLAGIGWFLTGTSFAAREEHKFQDPVTHRTGAYTVDFGDGMDAKQPRGLLVFFHGSGNGPGYAGNFAELARVAASFHLVPLAIQAPDGAATWPEEGIGPGKRHVAYVESLLKQVVFQPHPNLQPERLWLVGWSAGSTFISGDLLPAVIGRWGAGALLFCGGGPPLVQTKNNTTLLDSRIRGSFKLYSYIQSGDFLFNQTSVGLNYWQARGLAPVRVAPAGGGHCGFAFEPALSEGLHAVLGPPI